jgi:hypothetical protein
MMAERRPVLRQTASARDEEDNGKSPHEGAREADGELVLAEHGHGDGIQPVVEGGLLEVLDIVEHRCDEVAPFQHFAGYLGVTPLIRINERETAQCLEKGEAENRKEEQYVFCRRPVFIDKLRLIMHFFRLMRSYCSQKTAPQPTRSLGGATGWSPCLGYHFSRSRRPDAIPPYELRVLTWSCPPQEEVAAGQHLLHDPDKVMGSGVAGVILVVKVLRRAEEESGGVAAMADLAQLLQPFFAAAVILRVIAVAVERLPVYPDHRGHVIDPLHPSLYLQGIHPAFTSSGI